MPGCCALNCSNRSEQGFMMKSFPRDPVRRALWASKVGRTDWEPTDNTHLCEAHFAEDQWIDSKTGDKMKLKKTAVPTIFEKSYFTRKRTPFFKKKTVSVNAEDEERKPVQQMPYQGNTKVILVKLSSIGNNLLLNSTEERETSSVQDLLSCEVKKEVISDDEQENEQLTITGDLPRDCDLQTADCSYCKNNFMAEFISPHEKHCMERPIKCPDCSEIALLQNWYDHECQTKKTEDMEIPTEAPKPMKRSSSPEQMRNSRCKQKKEEKTIEHQNEENVTIGVKYLDEKFERVINNQMELLKEAQQTNKHLNAISQNLASLIQICSSTCKKMNK